MLHPVPASVSGVKSVKVSALTRVVSVVHATSGEESVSIADLVSRLRRAGLSPRLRKSKKVGDNQSGLEEVESSRSELVAPAGSAAEIVASSGKEDEGRVDKDGDGDLCRVCGDSQCSCGDEAASEAKLPPWNVMLASFFWCIGLVGVLATTGTDNHNISEGHHELFSNHKWTAPDSIAFNTVLLLSIVLASPNIIVRAYGSLLYWVFDIVRIYVFSSLVFALLDIVWEVDDGRATDMPSLLGVICLSISMYLIDSPTTSRSLPLPL